MFGLGIFTDDYIYSLPELQRIAIGIFFASLFLIISATYSDIRNEPGDFEWIYLIVSSFLLYFFDIRFIVLRIPFLGSIDLTFSFWGLPLLVIWVLLVVSIVEMLDFFEGWASSVIVIASFMYFYLNLTTGKGEVFTPVFFAILAGAVLGLFPFQVIRKKLLYGKSGNKLVGFLFAAGTVIARRKETTGRFILLPIAIILFIVVVVNFLFLESQLRPISVMDKESRN